jgi:hypothetical protein
MTFFYILRVTLQNGAKRGMIGWEGEKRFAKNVEEQRTQIGTLLWSDHL